MARGTYFRVLLLRAATLSVPSDFLLDHPSSPPLPQTPYYSPVNPAAFGTLALILIGSGLSFMALFFVYEMKVSNARECDGPVLIGF